MNLGLQLPAVTSDPDYPLVIRITSLWKLTMFHDGKSAIATFKIKLREAKIPVGIDISIVQP